MGFLITEMGFWILEMGMHFDNGIAEFGNGNSNFPWTGTNNMHIVKDNLFKTPDLFKLIAQESKADYSEMYSVFNMGHRIEFYTDIDTAKKIIQIAQSFNIESKIIGKCIASPKKKLTIKSDHGEFVY